MLRVVVLCAGLTLVGACRASIDVPDSAGLQTLPIPGAGGAIGLPAAASPECRPAAPGEIVLNEYLVRPGGLDVDGDGKSNGRDEVLELALATGSTQVHLGGAQLLVDGQVRGQIAGQVCLDPRHLVVLVGSTSALVTWPEGATEVRLDHLLKLPDGGASLELRTAANELLFRHQYLAESGGAASSWTRSIDGDGAADWTRQLDLAEGHGRATTLGLCNNGLPACACLASQGMDCGGQ
jgi:hypothetical protein